MDKLKEFYQRSSIFFKEVWMELKKVSWPTWKETKAQSYAVIIIIIIMAIFLGLMDVMFKFVVLELLL